MEVSTQPSLRDLLDELARISEALEERQQRHCGLRASSRDHLEISTYQAEIKAMKREQAALRRRILESEEWSDEQTAI